MGRHRYKNHSLFTNFFRAISRLVLTNRACSGSERKHTLLGLNDGDYIDLRPGENDNSALAHTRDCRPRYSTAREWLDCGSFPSATPSNPGACRPRCSTARERLKYGSVPGFAFAEPGNRRSWYRATWERLDFRESTDTEMLSLECNIVPEHQAWQDRLNQSYASSTASFPMLRLRGGRIRQPTACYPSVAIGTVKL